MLASTATRFAHSLFLSLARGSGAMWPCCDFTSSDDDEHNTDSNFLLLFSDIGIMPTLLDGLTDVDVLHIALGCRFALDILIVSQHYSSTLGLGPHPDDPELFLFERCSHIDVLSFSPASWLAQCGFSCLEYCVRPSQSVISRTQLTHREARVLCVHVFSVSICVGTHFVALLRFSHFGACVC